MPLQFFEGIEKQGGAITEFMYGSTGHGPVHPSLMQIKKRERIIDRLYPGSQPHYSGSSLADVISGAVSFLQNNQDLIKSTIGVVGDINKIRKDINHIRETNKNVEKLNQYKKIKELTNQAKIKQHTLLSKDQEDKIKQIALMHGSAGHSLMQSAQQGQGFKIY